MAKPKNREATEELLYQHSNFLPARETPENHSATVDDRLPVF
jgi:hypothetical protein